MSKVIRQTVREKKVGNVKVRKTVTVSVTKAKRK